MFVRIAIVLAVLAGFNCRGHRDPDDKPFRFPPKKAEYVRVPTSIKISRVDRTTPAIFRAIDWATIKWPAGRTDRDLTAATVGWVAIAMPYDTTYERVPDTAVVWTNDAPRSVPQNNKALLFSQVEDAIGRALADYRCHPLADLMEDIVEEQLIPDSVALAIMDSIGVDPAAFDDIREAGKRTYFRPPTWGEPADPRLCDDRRR
jgi:hypothetical protein